MFTGEESNPIQKCLPFDQFEHEGTRAFLLYEPVDGADVRMIQRTRQARFEHWKARHASDCGRKSVSP